MTVAVHLPDLLRGKDAFPPVVRCEAESVAGMIEVLDQQYPGLADRLLDSSGLRRYLNVYVGAHDVRFGDGLATTIPHGERVTILPASSGGMFLP